MKCYDRYQSIFRGLDHGRDCMNNSAPIAIPFEQPGSSRMAIALVRQKSVSGIVGKRRYLVAKGRTTTGKGLFPHLLGEACIKNTDKDILH